MAGADEGAGKKQRVALVIQYLGTHFHGWQRQHSLNPATGGLQSSSLKGGIKGLRTVQDTIETAISEVIEKPVTLHAAGRTDAGVHAAAQVAHFDQESPIPPTRWATILNSRLPEDVTILASGTVKEPWHARFSALWRRYRYTIYTGDRPNLFLKQASWHYYQAPLDSIKMQAALEPLLGRHHLAAFHRAGSRRRHSWVEVQEAKCYCQGPLLYLEIQANGFLYGMVRLLVGMLVEVGNGSRSWENFTEIWVNQRREAVKYAAPAKGLCLLRVGYQDFPFPPNIWFDTQPIFYLQ